MAGTRSGRTCCPVTALKRSARGELAVLRLNSATRHQLLHMVRIEQAVLLGQALTVGGEIAMPTLTPMINGATVTVTYPSPQ